MFPNNAFNIAKNGQSNRVVFNIANKTGQDRYLTLEAITGAFLNKKKAEGQKGFVLRNVSLLDECTTGYGLIRPHTCR